MTNAINKINILLSRYGIMVLFLVFMILEGFGKSYLFSKSHTQVPLIIKSIILVFSGVFIFSNLKKNKKNLILLSVLFLVFIFGQLTINPSFSLNSLTIAIKFFTPLLFFILFKDIHIPKSHQKITFQVFERVMVLNSILILIGSIVNIYFFKSYLGNRFGFSGIFQTPGVTSYSYLITLFYFVISYKKDVIKNWKFLIIYLTCFLVGTKALFLGLLVVTFYVISIQRFRFKKIFNFLSIIIISIAAYLFFFKYGIFNSISESKGLISAILSYRDRLLINNTLPYIDEHWSWINYLFGGVSDYNLRSQMEVVDVFFFWGILGGALYLYSYIKKYITFKMNKELWLFFILLAFIIFLAGNFFAYSMIIVFLLVLKERIFISQENSYI